MFFLNLFFLFDMHPSDFLCAPLDECNISGVWATINKLCLQNFPIFTAEYGKF